MSQPPRDVRARRRETPALRIRSARREPAAISEKAPKFYPSRLEAIVESLTDGVLEFDDSGVFDANSAAARLFGYKRSELIGVDICALLPGLRNGVRHHLRKAQTSEGRRKDGSSFPIQLTLNEARSPRGRAFVGVARDLTDQRRAETLLQEQRAEFTYASRLIAMGELAAALAHEINQPFAAAATYVRTARWLLERKSKRPDSDLEVILEKAATQVMRAGEIIRHLREFVTRGESVKTVQRLSTLVEEAKELALVGVRQNEAHVTMRLKTKHDYVLADRIQAQQVVVNLVRNALEAMQDAPRRELVLTTSRAGPDFVRLDVIDTGHGLSDAVRATLFEPFRTTKATGMGVGLSISRSIVEAHGGRIWAEPNPEGGAIFSFTLPVVQPADAR